MELEPRKLREYLDSLEALGESGPDRERADGLEKHVLKHPGKYRMVPHTDLRIGIWPADPKGKELWLFYAIREGRVFLMEIRRFDVLTHELDPISS